MKHNNKNSLYWLLLVIASCIDTNLNAHLADKLHDLSNKLTHLQEKFLAFRKPAPKVLKHPHHISDNKAPHDARLNFHKKSVDKNKKEPKTNSSPSLFDSYSFGPHHEYLPKVSAKKKKIYYKLSDTMKGAIGIDVSGMGRELPKKSDAYVQSLGKLLKDIDFIPFEQKEPDEAPEKLLLIIDNAGTSRSSITHGMSEGAHFRAIPKKFLEGKKNLLLIFSDRSKSDLNKYRDMDVYGEYLGLTIERIWGIDSIIYIDIVENAATIIENDYLNNAKKALQAFAE